MQVRDNFLAQRRGDRLRCVRLVQCSDDRVGRVVGLSGILGDGRLDLGQLHVLSGELAGQEVDLARGALREEDPVGR